MRRRLFTIGGTDVCLHLATPLFALYMLLIGEGTLLWTAGVSILLHEIGHAACAAWCGHPPEELELTPLGCLLRLDDDAVMSAWQRLVTILAGPFVTALLMLLALRLTEMGWLMQETGRRLFACNAAILLVNLLPTLPLDGGRALAMLLGLRLRSDTVRRVMRAVGTALGVALVGCNAAVCLRFGGWNLSLMCAGCFLIYAGGMATATAAMQQLRQLIDRKQRLETRGHLRAAGQAAAADLTLHQAVKLLHPSRYTQFVVVERGTMRELGLVGEERLIAAYLQQPSRKLRELV